MTTVWDDLTGPERLADSRYVLLTAYTPDGTPKQYPCKVVPDGDAIGIVLRTRSPEAECLRRRRGVLIGACDASGNLIGPQWPARAAFCDPDRTAQYRMALINKYGLLNMVSLALQRLREGLDSTTGVRLTPADRRWPVLGPAWRPGAAYSPN